MLKKYFDKNPAVTLSKDHTSVAFSEDQVYNLIRIACDEAAHASFEMMNGLLQRASQHLIDPLHSPSAQTRNLPTDSDLLLLRQQLQVRLQEVTYVL